MCCQRNQHGVIDVFPVAQQLTSYYLANDIDNLSSNSELKA